MFGTLCDNVAGHCCVQVIGMGAGQQSRIHCTRLAGDKADNWSVLELLTNFASFVVFLCALFGRLCFPGRLPGCLQLMEVLEISWIFQFLLEIYL